MKRMMRMLMLRSLVGLLAGILLLPSIAARADGIGDLVGKISEASYRHYLDEELFTHDGDNRSYAGGAEHDAARDNILAHFEAEGLDAFLDPFEYGGKTYYNVVGIHEGVTNPEQIYIIGAHYDSAGTPGADDDGSGVAGMMEAARVMSDYRFDATIIFIGFDVEEAGLIGSDRYATKHAGDDIRGMISLDMMAYDWSNDEMAMVFGRSASDPIKTALGSALDTYANLTVEYYGTFDRSDHAPFEWQGFDACLLSEYDSNPNYHTQKDSVDTPNYINYSYATRMTKAAAGCIAGMAGYLGPMEYTMAEPWPGYVNRKNTFAVSGATPGVKTFMVYGFDLGLTNVPNCPGVVVDIAKPNIFYRGLADGQGDVSVEKFTHQAVRGRTVYLQGVEVATCQTTNLVEFIFE